MSFVQKHINLRNLIALMEAKMKGIALEHPSMRFLIGHVRKLKHRAKRIANYSRRNASYPFQSKQEIARRVRQIAAGSLTVHNGLAA